MNIIQKRNDIDNLLQDIIDEFNEMYIKYEDNHIDLQNENHRLKEELFQQSNNISENIKEKNEYELEISKLNKQKYEYEKIIRDLEDKLNSKLEENKETNKFNMMITQANELAAKDREIDRLNKLVLSLKKTINNKPDNLVNNLRDGLNDEKEVIVKEDVKDDIKEDVKEDVENVDNVEKDIENVEEETDDMSEDDRDIMNFTYKNKEYFYVKDDNENIVYNSKECNKIIGKWGVTKSGKMKFIKNK